MTSTRRLRVAVTETVNVFADMPPTLDRLDELAGKLERLRAANVAHHIELMRNARAQGVQIIGFGELFPGPYFALGKDPMWFALAEDAAHGKTVTELQAAAKELELVVVAPIYELDPSGQRFNTAVVIDETGALLGKYRKTHLPCGENEQGSFDEPFYYERSDGQNGSSPANRSNNPFFPVFETRLGKVGVAICYDRHFEGVMYSLAHEGAELVFAPAVTFGQKSERMWQLEFQVDAARHGLFIAGSNRRGTEPPWTQPYFGGSHITGPNGVLPNLSSHENLIVSDVELGELSAPDPSGWNLARDVRYESYSRRG